MSGAAKRLFVNHPRLWISAAAGTSLVFVLPQRWPPLSRMLVGWNCGVLLFLALLFLWMRRLTARQMHLKYVDEDESAPFILMGVIFAAISSLVAIVNLLPTLKSISGAERGWHFVLAAATLVDSWLLVPTMFATHYADAFYSAPAEHRPLRFPNTPLPVFWDFAYFSFTIAAACQTADVSTSNAGMRRIVLGHTLVSFLFNASILGFAINVTAGLF